MQGVPGRTALVTGGATPSGQPDARVLRVVRVVRATGAARAAEAVPAESAGPL